MPTPKEQKPIRVEDDAFQLDFVTRFKRQPAPLVAIDAAPYVCLKINVEWFSHVLGALDTLNQGDAWLGDENEVFRARQEIERLIAQINQPCEVPEHMLRQNGCVLEQSTDGGMNWIPVFDSSLCVIEGPPGPPGPAGPPGAQGPVGAPGQDGVCLDCDTPAPTPPTTNNNDDLCGIATYLTNWHDGLWRDYLQAAENSADVGAAIAAAATAIFSVGVGGAIWDILGETIADAFTAGVSSILTTISTSKLEAFQCLLYCDLKATNGFNSGTISRWAAAVLAEDANNVGNFYWSRSLESFAQSEWNLRAKIGALSPSAACALLCDECLDECDATTQNVNFVNTAPDAFCWAQYVGNLNVFPNVGLNGANSSGTTAAERGALGWNRIAINSHVAIFREWTTPFTLTSFSAQATMRNNTGAPTTVNTRVLNLYVRIAGQTAWTRLAQVGHALNTGPAQVTVSWSGSLQVDRLAVVGVTGGANFWIENLRFNA